MKKAYDRQDAKRLVPLLDAISREITDRLAAIERGEARLEHCRGASRKRERQELLAQLANHRRELRLARKELETLGCVQDEKSPTEVLIPGADGALENGYRWSFGDAAVRARGSEVQAS